MKSKFVLQSINLWPTYNFSRMSNSWSKFITFSDEKMNFCFYNHCLTIRALTFLILDKLSYSYDRCRQDKRSKTWIINSLSWSAKSILLLVFTNYHIENCVEMNFQQFSFGMIKCINETLTRFQSWGTGMVIDLNF